MTLVVVTPVHTGVSQYSRGNKWVWNSSSKLIEIDGYERVAPVRCAVNAKGGAV